MGGRFLRQLTNETGSVKEIHYSGYLRQARIYIKQYSLTFLEEDGVKHNIVNTASERPSAETEANVKTV